MNGRLARPKRFYEAARNARAIADPYGRIKRSTDHLSSTFNFLLRTGDRELECRLITNAVGTDTRVRGISKQRQDKAFRGKYCAPQRPRIVSWPSGREPHDYLEHIDTEKRDLKTRGKHRTTGESGSLPISPYSQLMSAFRTLIFESPKEQFAHNCRRSRRASKLIQRHASTLCKG
jgi:hypothetical protein